MTSPDTSTARPDSGVPDWLLERYALGELPADRLDALRMQIEADPTLAARLRDLQNHNRAVLLQHPPRIVAHEVSRRVGMPPTRTRRSAKWAAVPAFAAVAMALFFVRSPSLGPDVLSKGRSAAHGYESIPELRIFRADDGELTPGDEAKTGDTLGFRYHAQGRQFGALLSIDGAGAVTLHMPKSGDEALKLKEGLVTVDLGYELDDAPGFERFFLVLSETPFHLSAVMDAADLLAREDAETGLLELASRLEVVDFVVDKEPR